MSLVTTVLTVSSKVSSLARDVMTHDSMRVAVDLLSVRHFRL